MLKVPCERLNDGKESSIKRCAIERYLVRRAVSRTVLFSNERANRSFLSHEAAHDDTLEYILLAGVYEYSMWTLLRVVTMASEIRFSNAVFPSDFEEGKIEMIRFDLPFRDREIHSQKDKRGLG